MILGIWARLSKQASIYPGVQNRLLAARALYLGATLTRCICSTRRKRRPHSACLPVTTPMPCCRSATRWDGLGLSAMFRSSMWSMKASTPHAILEVEHLVPSADPEPRKNAVESVRHQPRPGPLALHGRLGSGFSRSVGRARYQTAAFDRSTLISGNFRRSVLDLLS